MASTCAVLSCICITLNLCRVQRGLLPRTAHLASLVIPAMCQRTVPKGSKKEMEQLSRNFISKSKKHFDA